MVIILILPISKYFSASINSDKYSLDMHKSDFISYKLLIPIVNY